jgi:L-rhamnose isomerase
MFAEYGIELWSNIETFQRPFPGHGEPRGVFRQVDYRSLYTKLTEASPLVKRIITYEYFSCMSPNTEWGSARRLLARYLEMIGKDPVLIDEIYGR